MLKNLGNQLKSVYPNKITITAIEVDGGLNIYCSYGDTNYSGRALDFENVDALFISLLEKIDSCTNEDGSATA